MNHVLHIAAIVQIRHDTEGRAYYRRKIAAGKTPMEALRCLKRRLSDAVYRQLVADATHDSEASPGGHSGASSQSSAADLSTPVIGSSDQPLPGPAPTTLPAVEAPAKTTAVPAPRPSRRRRSRQGGAPHRTNDLDGDKRRRTLNGVETAPLTQRGTRSGWSNYYTDGTRSESLTGRSRAAGQRTVRLRELAAIAEMVRVGRVQSHYKTNRPSGPAEPGLTRDAA
jgi:hypothetical protein